jgi:hypothetical protein
MRNFTWAFAALILFCAGAAAQQSSRPQFQQAMPQDQTALLRQDVANLAKMVQQLQVAVQQVQTDARQTNEKVPDRGYFQSVYQYLHSTSCGVFDLRNLTGKRNFSMGGCDRNAPSVYPE